MSTDFRSGIADLIRREALPEDKFGHQPRLYALTREIGAGLAYDDDVVYAAAWLHDLGVFTGHRPEDPQELARWNHVPYTVEKVREILEHTNFRSEKISAVLRAIETHQPKDDPATIEAVILRDADILEQLGAIGILRGVSKVGRDTRYKTFSSVIEVLQRSLEELPAKLRLDSSKELAKPKIALLDAFLSAVENEGKPSLF